MKHIVRATLESIRYRGPVLDLDANVTRATVEIRDVDVRPALRQRIFEALLRSAGR